jgi:hypothetical protein
VAEMTGAVEDAGRYRSLAVKMKESYFRAFYNPESGLLAGWKSRNGKLHDYFFLMVNSMAIYYEGFLCDGYLALPAFNPEDR